MARGDKKKGREEKKPKQEGGRKKPQSDYASRQSESYSAPLKIRNK